MLLFYIYHMYFFAKFYKLIKLNTNIIYYILFSFSYWLKYIKNFNEKYLYVNKIYFGAYIFE